MTLESEAKKLGNDFLFLLPGGLKSRKEYLEKKYQIYVSGASYAKQWESLESQLGLEKTVALIVEDFLSTLSKEKLLLLRRSMKERIPKETVSEKGLYPLIGEDGMIEDLGMFVLRYADGEFGRPLMPRREIKPEAYVEKIRKPEIEEAEGIPLEREVEEEIYELRLCDFRLTEKGDYYLHKNLEDIAEFLLHKLKNTPSRYIKQEHETSAPGYLIRLDVYDERTKTSVECKTYYKREEISGWTDNTRRCYEMGFVREAWLIIPTKSLGDNRVHFDQCLDELKKAGVKYRVFSFDEVFTTLENLGCRPAFRVVKEAGWYPSIEIYYKIPRR